MQVILSDQERDDLLEAFNAAWRDLLLWRQLAMQQVAETAGSEGKGPGPVTTIPTQRGIEQTNEVIAKLTRLAERLDQGQP